MGRSWSGLSWPYFSYHSYLIHSDIYALNLEQRLSAAVDKGMSDPVNNDTKSTIKTEPSKTNGHGMPCSLSYSYYMHFSLRLIHWKAIVLLKMDVMRHWTWTEWISTMLCFSYSMYSITLSQHSLPWTASNLVQAPFRPMLKIYKARKSCFFSYTGWYCQKKSVFLWLSIS